jgi:ribosomal protein L11 methyltransferase
MREVVLRVQRAALDEVLDRLLPVVPGGVREVPSEGSEVELLLRGDELPALERLAAVVTPAPYELAERRVSDDWRERRQADYRVQPIGGRLAIRPTWAPAPDPRLIDISVADSAAFGVGAHPTTRACLELLLELAPAGAFADLGCGTGVLAILASRLGWAPVIALDFHPASVDAARENAARNGAPIDVRLTDLVGQPPPPAAGFAANVPPEVHAAIASNWRAQAPATGLVSGFGAEAAEQVMAAYASCGLHERRRVQRVGWVIAELGRG